MAIPYGHSKDRKYFFYIEPQFQSFGIFYAHTQRNTLRSGKCHHCKYWARNKRILGVKTVLRSVILVILDAGLCISNEGSSLKYYEMNSLDNVETLLFCFLIFVVRRPDGVCGILRGALRNF